MNRWLHEVTRRGEQLIVIKVQLMLALESIFDTTAVWLKRSAGTMREGEAHVARKQRKLAACLSRYLSVVAVD